MHSHTASQLLLPARWVDGPVFTPPLAWNPADVRHPAHVTGELLRLADGYRAAAGQLVPQTRLAHRIFAPALLAVHVPRSAYPAGAESPVLRVTWSPAGAEAQTLAQVRLRPLNRIVGGHATAWTRLPASSGPGRIGYAWVDPVV